MAYSEFRFFSPVMDCDAIRISMQGKQPGTEFFRIIRVEDGRRYRERRDEALHLIQLAIDAGLEPGEVFPA